MVLLLLDLTLSFLQIEIHQQRFRCLPYQINIWLDLVPLSGDPPHSYDLPAEIERHVNPRFCALIFPIRIDRQIFQLL